MDGGQPPKQADIFLGVLRVCMALKTLQCCGGASWPEQRSALRAMHTLNLPKIIPAASLGVCHMLSPIHLMHRHGAQGLMWGSRGPFQLAAALVVAVVMPVVCRCSMARAQTTLFQWNPDILDIAKKLERSPRRSRHHTGAATWE
jgi:hypothetical protein